MNNSPSYPQIPLNDTEVSSCKQYCCYMCILILRGKLQSSFLTVVDPTTSHSFILEKLPSRDSPNENHATGRVFSTGKSVHAIRDYRDQRSQLTALLVVIVVAVSLLMCGSILLLGVFFYRRLAASPSAPVYSFSINFTMTSISD